MRRLLVGLCAIGALTLPLGGWAVAKPPVGSCPSSEWFIGPAPVDTTGGQSTDQNGDGLSCFLEKPEGGGIFTIVDNNSHSR